MSLHVQASFSGGELDPALRERTTFDKFQSGLAKGRNTIIGKTGRVISRMSRAHMVQCKTNDSKVRIYSPPNSGYLLEFGHHYARVYNFDGTQIGSDQSHTWDSDELVDVHFDSSGDYIYCFLDGKQYLKFNYVTPAFIDVTTALFNTPPPGSYYSTDSVLTGTGYTLDYAFTFICAGQESYYDTVGGFTFSGIGQMCSGTETNTLVARELTASLTNVSEMRVYRRPRNGGAFGYIGSTTYKYTSGSYTLFKYIDHGEAADYSHSPPNSLNAPNEVNEPYAYFGNTGAIYQQRLLLAHYYDKEAILASRPGFQNNFSRDFPLNSASRMQFKAGTSGHARVLRMVDSDGLVVFTTIGVFLHTGELSPSNLALSKKGSWIINNKVAPLVIPGGVIFMDASTNTVRQLSWSTEQASYVGNELSTFSNHLFQEKQVVSWAFHEGALACLIAVFDDGTYAHFTFEPEQQMRAWTPGDSNNSFGEIKVEEVAGTGYADKTFFLIAKDDGTTVRRYIEYTVPRYVSGATLEDDPEAYMNHSNTILDSMSTWRHCFNDYLNAGDAITVTPVTPDDWTGDLQLTTNATNVFDSPYGSVGEIFRYFNADGTTVDYEVTTHTGPRDIIVTPVVVGTEFPADYATTARFYLTTVQVTGLTHLLNEDVSVMVDGWIVASPYNTNPLYPTRTVDASGHLDLLEAERGAIIHIGRPVICDVETLDIDTVEQHPTLIESLTVNKVYIKNYKSRGLYVGNEFPDNDMVDGTMQDIETLDIENEDTPIVENTYKAPQTKRNEVIIPGDWKSQGRICIRQVDPLPFEILSIIPDLEELRR